MFCCMLGCNHPSTFFLDSSLFYMNWKVRNEHLQVQKASFYTWDLQNRICVYTPGVSYQPNQSKTWLLFCFKMDSRLLHHWIKSLKYISIASLKKTAVWSIKINTWEKLENVTGVAQNMMCKMQLLRVPTSLVEHVSRQAVLLPAGGTKIWEEDCMSKVKYYFGTTV